MSMLKQVLATTEPAVDLGIESTTEDLMVDMMELATEQVDIENNLEDIEVATGSLESLNDIIMFKENLVAKEKGMDGTAAAMAQVAVESICTVLHFPYDEVDTPSFESHEQSPEVATTLSLEADKGIFAKAWDAIVAVFQKIVAKVSAFFAKVVKKFTPVATLANRAIDKAGKMAKDGYEAANDTFESKGLVGKFGIIIADQGAKVLTAEMVASAQEYAGAGVDISAVDSISATFTKVGTGDVSALGKLPGLPTGAKYKNTEFMKFAKKEPTFTGNSISGSAVITGYGSSVTGLVELTSDDKPSQADLDKFKDAGTDEKTVSGILSSSIKTVTVDIDKNDVAADTKINVVGLNAVKDMLKNTVKVNAKLGSELTKVTKAFDNGTKAITTAKKNLSGAGETDQEKQAAKLAIKAMNKVFMPTMSAYSSLTTKITMNVLKASLAQISYVNASLGEYKKA